MTPIRTPKFWLLATAALLLGSHISAEAQVRSNFQTGAPTMVAAAPSLPTISAEQIARDVAIETNPRTGVNELFAAPFDPFEEDPALAASLRLRSAEGLTAIDGRRLHDGAIVEIDFYYNSPSDDPYGGRNYSDAAFVNGELASVVLRDSRILECSTRVDNVVYDHVNYYGAGFSSGVYRPYRHYVGHSSFGFGFGNSYFGPGFGFSSNRSFFGNSRSLGSRFTSRSNANRRITSRRGLSTRRTRSALTNRRLEDRRQTRVSRRDERAASRIRTTDRDSRLNSRRRLNGSTLRDRQTGSSLRQVRSNRFASGGTAARGNARLASGQSTGNTRLRTVKSSTNSAPARAQSSQAASTQNATRQTRSSRPSSRQNTLKRSSNGRNESRNNRSNRKSNTRSNTRSTTKTSRKNTSAPSRRRSGNSFKRKLNFFPNDGYGGRHVVSAHSVDCAREDKLQVFIPNARLDAARFDGLTLIALDAQGGETPIYLPSNYIEGFRLAATGRVQPQGFVVGP